MSGEEEKSSAPAPAAAAAKLFSMSEVEKHKVAKGPDRSIWIVLHDKVYDVTKFLDEVSIYRSIYLIQPLFVLKMSFMKREKTDKLS